MDHYIDFQMEYSVNKSDFEPVGYRTRYQEYVSKQRRLYNYGTALELRAMAFLYQLNFDVYAFNPTMSFTKITFYSNLNSSKATYHLAYFPWTTGHTDLLFINEELASKYAEMNVVATNCVEYKPMSGQLLFQQTKDHRSSFTVPMPS